MRFDFAEEPQDIGFVSAFFMLPRENKRSLGELDRAIRPAGEPLRFNEPGDAERGVGLEVQGYSLRGV